MHDDQIEPRKAAVAVIVICIATGALGGFAGCTFDFIQVTRASGSTFSFFQVGAAIGLVIGLLASLKLRSPKTPSYNALYRSFLGLGYALAWLTASCLAFWVSHQIGKAYSRNEVFLPIRFDRPNRVEATFTAEFDGTHEVLLDLERKIPFEELDAFVGGWADPDKPPPSLPQRPVIRWRVEPLHKQNQEAYWKGHSYGETISAEIGEFQAVEGQRYTLIAEVTQPAPKMQVLNPHLQVQAIYRWMGPLTVTWIASFYAGLGAGGIGIVLLIRWVVTKRREAKRSAVPDQDSQNFP